MKPKTGPYGKSTKSEMKALAKKKAKKDTDATMEDAEMAHKDSMIGFMKSKGLQNC